MARRIAAGATWRPVLTDERTGELTARGAGTYRPPAALAGLVVDRDVTCTFPGCRVPAGRCDLDHIRPFDERLPAEHQTRVDNLQALCRHHHRLKTHSTWSPERDPVTGRTQWRSPTGHTYTRDPVPTDPTDRPRRPERTVHPNRSSRADEPGNAGAPLGDAAAPLGDAAERPGDAAARPGHAAPPF